ncbi:MAG: beta-galactosidase, partial [Chloroflexi bacterium]|nr:beta-galactosidase [Chloroflexota bacterium]
AGQISDVGADWSAEAFVETLRRAHVNSINLFARCHHGYVYYMPSRYAIHPALTFDLLGEQVSACRSVGIASPVYITVGWDELAAARHPEWLEVTPEGVLGQHSPLEARWKKLCLNSPYLDYVLDQARELIEHLGGAVDGLWYDILHQGECVCGYCRRDMLRQGLDPARAEDRQAFAACVRNRARQRLYEDGEARVPGTMTFFNSGHVGYDQTIQSLPYFTHFELESLPSTGQWGYSHYPISVRYVRTLGKPHLGMTGKFHTSWGDFSSLKNQAALEFECFQMLANGAAVCIGDQLHPRGRLNPPTYDLIGRVYEQVEAKEPWCIDAAPQAEIAVFNVEAVGTEDGRVDSSNAGALRMLMEEHQQFDFIDQRADWSRYKVIIFPDKVPFDEALAARVRRFLQGEGRVIASYRAGLTPAGDRFALPEFGLNVIGEAPNHPDYLRAAAELRADLPDTELVMYERGLETRALEGTRVLATVTGPYFNRQWDHFCSHRQTPMDPNNVAPYPAITQSADGKVIYFAHPIMAGYRLQAPLWYKRLLAAALGLALPEPMVLSDAPSSAQVTVTRQADQARTIVHLLHYVPERRGLEFDTIEDVIPLHQVRVGLRAADRPARLYLAPDGQDLPFEYADGRVWCTVPRVDGHAMLVIE